MHRSLGISGLLIVPHLRIQNANAISSQMTWGFPAISAFIGAMHALERRLARRHPLIFEGVGVICHDFEAQVTSGGFVKTFNLTRNPIDRDGSTAAIVEEGRMHLELTLVFGVDGSALDGEDDARAQVAQDIANEIAAMRIAGGSVMPSLPGQRRPWQRAELTPIAEQSEERSKQFKRLRRRWLPGFALVARDDLLMQRLAELREQDPKSSELDAWLDLSRLNRRSTLVQKTNPQTGVVSEEVQWNRVGPAGWIVPIPVGYSKLSELYRPGSVVNARDTETSFRFVEGMYSVGEWISPHRLNDANELLWYPGSDPDVGVYRCCNNYAVPAGTLQH
ncbi:MAG: type I-F CRISPR-associated protein Csy2 [Burkholderiales bacterium]|nr:type I-F CRISPR-associated protein Csy2 [Burkholderiales bacterium]